MFLCEASDNYAFFVNHQTTTYFYVKMLYLLFKEEDWLRSVCSLNVIHPTLNYVVGANSSGRLHVFM